MSSASPQRPHRVADWGLTPPIQSSQTGIRPARSKGPPQALQSAGKKVVTRSSTTARATLPGLRKTRETARHSTTPPRGPPGGAPVESPRALSFKHSLKTHLTRHQQIPCHCPQYKPSTPLHVNNSAPNQMHGASPNSRCYTPSQFQASVLCNRRYLDGSAFKLPALHTGI